MGTRLGSLPGSGGPVLAVFWLDRDDGRFSPDSSPDDALLAPEVFFSAPVELRCRLSARARELNWRAVDLHVRLLDADAREGVDGVRSTCVLLLDPCGSCPEEVTLPPADGGGAVDELDRCGVACARHSAPNGVWTSPA